MVGELHCSENNSNNFIKINLIAFQIFSSSFCFEEIRCKFERNASSFKNFYSHAIQHRVEQLNYDGTRRIITPPPIRFSFVDFNGNLNQELLEENEDFKFNENGDGISILQNCHTYDVLVDRIRKEFMLSSKQTTKSVIKTKIKAIYLGEI